MSEPENFVARWSRLKRKSAQEPRKAGAAAPGSRAEASPAVTTPAEPTDVMAKAGNPEEGAVDLASLPSIESITAATDIRGFLQPGVPAHLAREALRRAWTSDPAIRDFIGLAENQWDFTDPTAMAGFGPLEATDNVRQLVEQAMGELKEWSEQALAEESSSEVAEHFSPQDATAPSPAATSVQTAGMPQDNGRMQPLSDAEESEQPLTYAAAQHGRSPTESTRIGNRRTHGRALPK